MGCPFCELDFSKATFFHGEGWFAFLDSNSMLKGHTVVARDRAGACPDSLSEENLRGSHIVLPKVAEALRTANSAKHILVTSLRGKVTHMHFHVIPVTDADEKAWRLAAGWEGGHLHQFLGDREREAFLKYQEERITMGWTEKEQRQRHVDQMQDQVTILKALIDP